MSVESETPLGRKVMTPMESAFNIVVFLLFAVMWAGFAWAVIASQGSLDELWQWVRGLPMIAQALVWLLFLPVTAGLWIWESAWPAVVRLSLVAGIGLFNLYLFFPGYLLRR